MTQPQTQTAAYCSACGHSLRPAAQFCSACGTPLRAQSASPEECVYTQELRPLVPLIESRTEYYIRQFQRIRLTANPIAWNWSAFLLPFLWLAYRRMYLPAAICAAVTLPMLQDPIALVLLPIPSLLMGCFGNSLYLYHLQSLARRISSKPQHLNLDYIRRNQGPSPAAAILFSGGFLLLEALLIVRYII